jgi:hypothetical protein
MKPVYQFPIPPLHLPTSVQHSAVPPSAPLAAAAAADRRERDINSEPIPKRIRLDESDSDSAVSSDHQNSNEAQNLNVMNEYNQMIIFGRLNAQVSEIVA